MITKKILEELTGVKSFFEFYKELKRGGYDKQPYVQCVKVEPATVKRGNATKRVEVDEGVTIVVIECKAEALEELYDQLPTLADMEKISQSIDQFLPSHRREEVLHILSQIPTR